MDPEPVSESSRYKHLIITRLFEYIYIDVELTDIQTGLSLSIFSRGFKISAYRVSP
jgi:hypothetical protein